MFIAEFAKMKIAAFGHADIHATYPSGQLFSKSGIYGSAFWSSFIRSNRSQPIPHSSRCYSSPFTYTPIYANVRTRHSSSMTKISRTRHGYEYRWTVSRSNRNRAKVIAKAIVLAHFFDIALATEAHVQPDIEVSATIGMCSF